MLGFEEVEAWLASLKLEGIDVFELNAEISIYDDMYQGNFQHYYNVGIEAALFLSKNYSSLTRKSPSKILDFPCGYGRVTRWLRIFFPESMIYGSDLLIQGINFCTKMFDIRSFESNLSFKLISAPGNFDIIWVGSLITHLSEDKAQEMLEFLIGQLAPGGMLAVSYIGEEMEHKFQSVNAPYGLNNAAKDEIYAEYQKTGYGYANYPLQSGYGISLISEGWWRRKVSSLFDTKVYLHNLAWDKHHNIAVLVRGENTTFYNA